MNGCHYWQTMDSREPQAPVSLTRAHLYNREAVRTPRGSSPLPTGGPHCAAVVPSYCDSFKIPSFAQTVSCPVSSSELKSLDIRDLEAPVQQFLFQPPLGWLGRPSLQPDFTLENTVQYRLLIIYSS